MSNATTDQANLALAARGIPNTTQTTTLVYDGPVLRDRFLTFLDESVQAHERLMETLEEETKKHKILLTYLAGTLKVMSEMNEAALDCALALHQERILAPAS